MEDMFGDLRIRFKYEEQDVESVVNGLAHNEGRDFENAVVQAFEFLGFSANLTDTTEAESDVIVEALVAENPYYIVVECQAVANSNEVGYLKIGQIRGNAYSYADTRRQQLFKIGYKLVVGRPRFSSHAKRRALPDVGLASVQNLFGLLRFHEIFGFSQTQLQAIFGIKGEIEKTHILDFVRPFERKSDLYSLICISLLEDPYDEKHEKWKSWTPIEQMVGEALTYARFFGLREVTDIEIKNLIRDLDNPFLRVVELQGTQGRPCASLSAKPDPFAQMLKEKTSFFKDKLRNARTSAN